MPMHGAMNFMQILKKIFKNCLTCKSFAKTTVINFSLAQKLNKKVAMDLKSCGNKWILHLADMWSWLTIFAFNDWKTLQPVINAMLN